MERDAAAQGSSQAALALLLQRASPHKSTCQPIAPYDYVEPFGVLTVSKQTWHRDAILQRPEAAAIGKVIKKNYKENWLNSEMTSVANPDIVAGMKAMCDEDPKWFKELSIKWFNNSIERSATVPAELDDEAANKPAAPWLCQLFGDWTVNNTRTAEDGSEEYETYMDMVLDK
eukprot:5428443-Amphidinium_carterae.2